MDKYKGKLSKDDLKRFAKEVRIGLMILQNKTLTAFIDFEEVGELRLQESSRGRSHQNLLSPREAGEEIRPRLLRESRGQEEGAR